MAVIIKTENLKTKFWGNKPMLVHEEASGESIVLSREGQLWIYNAIDCCTPLEILPEVLEKMNENTRRIYKFELALTGPAVHMMLRGVKVDMHMRSEMLYDLLRRKKRLERYIDRIAVVVWGKPLNYRSHEQMKCFFYDWPSRPKHHHLGIGLDPIYTRGPKKTMTCDQKALEKIGQHYKARPIVKAILSAKNLEALIKVLKSGIDADGRMRFSFNVGATETGRWSSSKNAFGTGTNGQNITERMRVVFIADEGYMLAYPDLEQAEARPVAYLSGDEKYIAACESGDLHTTVARMIWPDLPWTGDLQRDRKIADQPFYRHFSYRDMSKRSGHLTNYWGTPFIMSVTLNMPQRNCAEFQEKYFDQFRGIPLWHLKVVEQLQETGQLVTPFGRVRTFFGRLNDDHTIKEAIAHVPQSTIADLMSLGILRVWRNIDIPTNGKLVQVLMNQHDGMVAQVRIQDTPEKQEKLLNMITEEMTIPVPVNGRQMIIPVSMKVGPNWRDLAEYNSPKYKDFTKQHLERKEAQAGASPFDILKRIAR